jgi:hypothetical protein
MKLIAHRGLFEGPDKDIENSPRQILQAWEEGFECEVDLWKIGGEFWLGHDVPQYKIELDFLITNLVWIHTKNLEALYWLLTHHTAFNYFWHQNDNFTLTSHQYIWTYPENELTDRSVMVMPEWADPKLSNVLNKPCYGICSDFVRLIRNKITTINS